MFIYKILKNFRPRVIKLFILAWYIGWASRIGYDHTTEPRGTRGPENAKRIYSRHKYFIPYENISLICNYRFPVGTALDAIVAFAWLCEKMNINIKIKCFNRAIFYLFENNVLALTKAAERSDPKKIEFSPLHQHGLAGSMAWVGIYFISSKYGHKIISKLSVKEAIIKSANYWLDKHIKGDWVAVHYRGTDAAQQKADITKWRYRINLEPYVSYLKSVLDDKCSIFACSDQAQFIDRMREAFPGRVFARDIERSYDNITLHRHDLNPVKEIDIFNRDRDALIDILILAKAELIYTTGSGFVDVVRYFNPKIKIVSMDGRRIGRGKNNVPMPRKDLFEKLSIPSQ